MGSVTLNDLVEHFGTIINEFSEELIDMHSSMNLFYEPFVGKERDKLILDILKEIETDNQKIGGAERTSVWFNGWEENLKNFRESGDLKDIIPKFIRPSLVARLNQRYIKPADVSFEKNFAMLIQRYIFDTYASRYKNVYEFGCGSGFNLVNLARWYPKKNLYGTDLAQSSVDLINEIAKKQKYNLGGEVFDMITPNDSYEIQKDSCVFTFGAIEQLAGKFEKFISYLLDKKPELCFHIEPTIEFYSTDTVLEDYLAAKFQSKRGYTSGFVPYLLDLELQGKIKVQKLHRINFGSKFIEGYNLIVWKPR